jgi:hypothetical protein
MSRPPLQFWFDFGSTYSYPAALRIAPAAGADGVQVLWRPFLLGPIFRLLASRFAAPPSFPEAAGWRRRSAGCGSRGKSVMAAGTPGGSGCPTNGDDAPDGIRMAAMRAGPAAENGATMNNRTAMLALAAGLVFSTGTAAAAEDAGPRVTIYNQDFALVKVTRGFDLEAGENEVRMTEVTSLMEPDSVILRDRRDPDAIRILEQNYIGETLSEGYLLSQYEGKVLTFQSTNPATGEEILRQGKLIRSGYVPHSPGWRFGGGGRPFAPAAGDSSPIVEVDGRIQFFLPGRPLFDGLGDDAILEPTLLWSLWSSRGGRHDLEMSYLTGGLRWEATYNLIAPEKGDRFDMIGWVTLTNQSGARFTDARIKLMAGDVSKLSPMPVGRAMDTMMMAEASMAAPPGVTEKAFDEYHLYTLQRPTTLRDREVKQVEFCRGSDVPGSRFYVYDGAQVQILGGGDRASFRANPSYGADGNTKVFAMLEFVNSKEAGLGIPLPRGTIKIYRTDDDGGREFIGENSIDHTPADETVRVFLGNVFDLVGERRQVDFQVDHDRRTASESFAIEVRNHKDEPVEVRVVERLYRWATWKVAESSDPFNKTDARTIEFRVEVPADGRKAVTYRVDYSW